MTELSKFLNERLQARCAFVQKHSPLLRKMCREYREPVTQEYVEITITRSGSETLKGWAKIT